MRQASDWVIGCSDSAVRVVPARRAEQEALAVLGDAGGVDIGAQRLGKRVMARHDVMLAAFLVQPELPAGALRPEILHLHLQRRADAREGIGEGGDQRPVAQIAHRVGRDGVEQLAPFVGVEHRRLAGLHHMLRAAHGRGRVGRHDLAGDQPVEQHPHRGELLLHAGRRMGLLERLYIGGDIERPDRGQRQAAIFAPGEELAARPRIGPARVRVADVGGEEFDVAPGGRARRRRRSAPGPRWRRRSRVVSAAGWDDRREAGRVGRS